MNRTVTNRALTEIEAAHQDYVEANMDNRYIETQTTKRNIDFWKRNSVHIRSANAQVMKQALRESSAEAKKLYADEKSYRKYCLSEKNEDMSRTLSLYTSSKVGECHVMSWMRVLWRCLQFDMPVEIQNRIKFSKR
jgi:ribonuclease HI